MPSKADSPAIARLCEDIPSGPEAVLILILLRSFVSLLMLLSKLCVVGVTLYTDWHRSLASGNFAANSLPIFMK